MSAVKARVDLYNGTTLVKTCTCSDVLEDFKITREGDTSKFFGFGVCHKLNVNFVDFDRELNVDTSISAEVGLGDGVNFDYPYPKFYIAEVNRDEKSNTITCTAYDKLYNAAGLTLADTTIGISYTTRQLAEACAALLGLTIKIINVNDNSFDTTYEEGGNFDGSEDLRSIFNAIAETTQTIYYVNYDNQLVFKRLDKNGEPVFTITKDDYYELNTKTVRTLTAICSTTELGDNIQAGNETGIIQYVRSNPLWELHPDRAALIDNAMLAIGGITSSQFDCDWGGDYRLEVCDKIGLVAEDNTIAHAFLLCDIVSYAGTLSEVTEWVYTEQSSETSNNPTNIGDKINQTFAKVDKVNKEIELVVSDVSNNKSRMAQIELDMSTVELSVSSLETSTSSMIDGVITNIDSLAKEVGLKLDDNEVSILVSNRIQQGVDKVITSSKQYTFDDKGLKISSAGNNLSTTITEDGMRVYRAGQEVLTADNEGVKAEDLHATTYLIIGNTSRLEDRENRTACFWIGD